MKTQYFFTRHKHRVTQGGAAPEGLSQDRTPLVLAHPITDQAAAAKRTFREKMARLRPAGKGAALAPVPSRGEPKAGRPDRDLSDNLARYLAVGSADALNIVRSVYEFHRFDMTLLERYLADRSPANLDALREQVMGLTAAGPSAPRF